MARNDRPNMLTPFLAGFLAWIVPGAGHVYLGRTLRGVILCVCINGLFWAGVAMGGVFTVEPVNSRWWFFAQMIAGASGVASWHRQERDRRAIADEQGIPPRPPADEAGNARWQRAFQKAADEKGRWPAYPTDVTARAYSGIAGMLNLMCIFDAVLLASMGVMGEPAAGRKRPEAAA